jgi:FkbM family methyltransferase
MGYELVDREDFSLFIDTECCGLGRQIKDIKHYEPHIEQYIIDNVEGKLFVDIGAHVGFFSCIAHAYGALEVLSIEPNPHVYRVLKANIAYNAMTETKYVPLGKWESIQFAAYDKECMADVILADDGNTGNTKVVERDTGTVRCSRIDSIIQGCHLVKIDVQGCELKVLEGMRNMYWECAIVEINDGEDMMKKEITEMYHRDRLRFEKMQDTLVVIRNEPEV